jgi:peroxiredoxin
MIRSSGESGISAFPVLADPAGRISAAYGVAQQMRIHGEWSNRPATFLIDMDGILRFRHLGTTFSDRPSVDKILRVARRARGAEAEAERGETTPTNEPADASLKTPEGEKPLEAHYSAEDFLRTAAASASGYTMVSVFHPTCTGCLTEAIALEAERTLWKELDVPVVGLAVTNDTANMARFVSRARASYRIASAPWAEKDFNVQFYPTLVIVDKEGKEVFRAAEEVEDPVGAAREFLGMKLGKKGN